MLHIDRRAVLLAGVAGIATGLASHRATSAASAASTREARDIAREAYLYFYPLISMDLTRRVTTNLPAGRQDGFGPANAFSHFRSFPAAEFRAVVRPNFDTLYSSAWLDLGQGPVVVSAPDTAGRYYMLPMLDMWSDVFAVPGKRTSGTQAANFAVVPPNWAGNLPAGLQRIEAPTPYVWVIGRTQTNGPADYSAVHRVQEGYRIAPLAQGDRPAEPVEARTDPTLDMRTPVKMQVDGMEAGDYFRYAAELLRVNPPHATDWSQVERMKRIGIVWGRPFDAATLDPALRSAVEQGAADALKLMADAAPGIARVVNGWQMNIETMGVYGNAYLKRAIVAQLGLGANQPEDAVYPLNVADAEGRPVTGEGRYVMHFESNALPPADAFWSLTMYDAEGFQVANRLNRFALGDRDALKMNADGSLDLYIQHEDPGEARRANWLPAPGEGRLGLTMRLYAPRHEVLDGRWAPPPVRRQ